MQVILRELLVRVGLLGVPVVLIAQRDDDFIYQRLAQPRDLNPGASLRASPLPIKDRRLLSARRGPHADHRARIIGIGGIRTIARQVFFARLYCDAMHIMVLRPIDSWN